MFTRYPIRPSIPLPIVLLTAGVFLAILAAAEPVILRTAKPYTSLVNEIRAAGGTVICPFRYVNAIIETTNSTHLQDGSGVFDQGTGLVNAAGAGARRAAGDVSDAPGLPGINNINVNVHLLQGAGEVSATVSRY